MKAHFDIRFCFLFALLMSQVLSCSNKTTGSNDDESVDTTPPAAITDLRASSVTTNTALLTWTAPGDDGTDGIAYEYDLRGALDSITADNFTDRYRVDSIDAPLPSGYTQTFLVEGLSEGLEYFFAIKSRDDTGNWSDISNCVNATCLEDIIVTFPDTALDRIIRETIDLPSGDIHMSDLQDLTDLNGEQVGIENLSGLENCISLHWLLLSWNNISDLTPLQTMTSLRTIALIDNNVSNLAPLDGIDSLMQLHLSGNPLSDISPLSNMDFLQWLRLDATRVRDFSPIFNLPALMELDLSTNQLGNISFITNFTQVKNLYLGSNDLADIAPLGQLTQLENLGLGINDIEDISALTQLTNIVSINLALNQISDIFPLVNNTGLGEDDEVYLWNNPLSQQSIDEYIPALEQRGVTVNY